MTARQPKSDSESELQRKSHAENIQAAQARIKELAGALTKHARRRKTNLFQEGDATTWRTVDPLRA
ncbi:hypothetical protein PCS_01840 [Desulfocurvibacter africanus PCS]|uniref:Uncharacterized protein n=1 Tax=Desulfocurvibacter africanus PCS TaxID=1262666 RepID=M5Q2D4_DESAF|nr:hypothetical protein [Desulfocurvibacter africanus]EMG37328.1 hypothetical protein PCS_01840 [Desulfocurvibacter africanus PCS]